MNSTQSDNTNSLSLALDARKAVKALVAFRKSGVRDEQLQLVLSDALASLHALNSGSSLYANLSSTSSYESYEQIQTVQEVQKAISDDRLTEKLEQLLRADRVEEQTQESVQSAIHFFTAIENRALQKYNQSFGFGL
jgi:hypothetical protein